MLLVRRLWIRERHGDLVGEERRIMDAGDPIMFEPDATESGEARDVGREPAPERAACQGNAGCAGCAECLQPERAAEAPGFDVQRAWLLDAAEMYEARARELEALVHGTGAVPRERAAYFRDLALRLPALVAENERLERALQEQHEATDAYHNELHALRQQIAAQAAERDEARRVNAILSKLVASSEAQAEDAALALSLLSETRENWFRLGALGSDSLRRAAKVLERAARRSGEAPEP
jgi:hypothetical protein